jgi:hypothetical protein
MINFYKKNLYTRILTAVERCNHRSVGLIGANDDGLVLA